MVSGERIDEALAAARRGERDAIDVLYRAFAGPLLGYLMAHVPRRQDAEDLLSDVFAAVVKDVGHFDGESKAFKGWLYRIATNRMIDAGRRRYRSMESSVAMEDIEGRVGSDDTAATADKMALWQAVVALPDEQRRVIGLRLAGDLSSPEIAEILGKSVGAVKALQHRALANLTAALVEAYPNEDPERSTEV